jgi:hypothetical protein
MHYTITSLYRFTYSLFPYTLYTKQASASVAARVFYRIVGSVSLRLEEVHGRRKACSPLPQTHTLRATRSIRHMRNEIRTRRQTKGSRITRERLLGVAGVQGTAWVCLFSYCTNFCTALLLHSLRTRCIYTPNLPLAYHGFTSCGHLRSGSLALHGYRGTAMG